MLKITVEGNPISKSNFKLAKKDGTPYMPSKGKHAKYLQYEYLVSWSSYEAWRNSKYKDKVFEENVFVVLKLYFKDRRNRDIHNYPKSICDGLEKSGIITNDKILKPFLIIDDIDRKNPRAEIELYPSSEYNFNYVVEPKGIVTTEEAK